MDEKTKTACWLIAGALSIVSIVSWSQPEDGMRRDPEPRKQLYLESGWSRKNVWTDGGNYTVSTMNYDHRTYHVFTTPNGGIFAVDRGPVAEGDHR